MQKLISMREIFSYVLGNNLKKCKNCLEEIVTEIEKVVDGVPLDFVTSFTKMYFRMRHLKKSLMFEKRKLRENRRKTN